MAITKITECPKDIYKMWNGAVSSPDFFKSIEDYYNQSAESKNNFIGIFNCRPSDIKMLTGSKTKPKKIDKLGTNVLVISSQNQHEIVIPSEQLYDTYYIFGVGVEKLRIVFESYATNLRIVVCGFENVYTYLYNSTYHNMYTDVIFEIQSPLCSFDTGGVDNGRLKMRIYENIEKLCWSIVNPLYSLMSIYPQIENYAKIQNIEVYARYIKHDWKNYPYPQCGNLTLAGSFLDVSAIAGALRPNSKISSHVTTSDCGKYTYWNNYGGLSGLINISTGNGYNVTEEDLKNILSEDLYKMFV